RLEQLLSNKDLYYLRWECLEGQLPSLVAGMLRSRSKRLQRATQSLVTLLPDARSNRSKCLAVRIGEGLELFDQSNIYAIESEGRNACWIHLALKSRRVTERLYSIAPSLDE